MAASKSVQPSVLFKSHPVAQARKAKKLMFIDCQCTNEHFWKILEFLFFLEIEIAFDNSRESVNSFISLYFLYFDHPISA